MSNLVVLLRQAECLLRDCSWPQQADWFSKKAELWEAVQDGNLARVSELNDIQDILAGAGSFSDLPMVPTVGSGLTETEARDKVWELVGAIDDAIEASRSDDSQRH